MERVIPVIEAIHREIDVVLSVDTTKSAVAEEALAAGASVVNDISAMRFDEHMADVVAKHDAFVILMHMKGVPKTMQEAPAYEDPVAEVCTFLARRAAVAQSSGIARSRIFLDPGVGFGKRLSDNLSLIAGIRRIRKLGFPLVVGTSRKSFLKAILDLPADERLEGTIAANAVAIANGADIIRVHDVKEGRRTADVAFRLRNDRD
jgi:dihydropteroate synthase